MFSSEQQESSKYMDLPQRLTAATTLPQSQLSATHSSLRSARTARNGDPASEKIEIERTKSDLLHYCNFSGSSGDEHCRGRLKNGDKRKSGDGRNSSSSASLPVVIAELKIRNR